MYGIAVTVSACLQAGTRADVAWLVGADGLSVRDWSDAVVITPGGGHIGSLLDGAVDGSLAVMAGRWGTGRLVEVEVTPTDALIAGLPGPGTAHCILAPADTFPAAVWDLAAARERFCIVATLDGDEVSSIDAYSERTIEEAEEPVQSSFADHGPGTSRLDDLLVSNFAAAAQMVVVGAGPVAEAVAELARFLDWQTTLSTDPGVTGGLMALLTRRDMVVVAAHDLELAGAALSGALQSDCGYIGSVGSRKMQADRADWLAYRGVTDLDRVHGPAGLDIGADSPREIGVAIVAEAIEAIARR